MLPYYLVVIIPFFFAFFSYVNNVDIKGKKKNYEVVVFFLIYFIILALRDITVGIDLENYFYYYEQIGNMDWLELSQHHFEKGYVYLNKIVYLISGGDFRFLLIIIAIITCFPIMYFYKKESYDGEISILLYISATPLFLINFSGIRQAIAIAFAIPIYYACVSKKIFRFIFYVFMASLFHTSAWIMLVMYPLCRIKIDYKRFLSIVVPVIIFIFAFKTQLFNFFLKFLSDKYQELYGTTTETDAIMMVILIGLFVVFSFVFVDEKEVDSEFNGLRVIIIFAFILIISCARFIKSLSYYICNICIFYKKLL